MSDLQRRDRQVAWHPFTPMRPEPDLLPVASARGAWLELADGRRLIDGISSWWVNLHGHGHPEIARAIAAQAERLDHVLFAGFTHEPAVALAEILVAAGRASGAPVSRVFYSDNGSTSVEVALKLAYQYHLNRGVAGRDRFLALSGSYHGDTFGSMAVSDPDGYHARFRKLLAPVDFVEPDDTEALERELRAEPRRYAAMIVEPMIQGAGGMRIYSPEFLRRAAELCEAHDVLLICDEVFTGFFRTGRMFAFEHAGISPDLVCVSKGITGGTLPLAATLVSERIRAAFDAPGIDLAFLHGHSYTANPIACAAALASWRVLASEDCQRRIARITARTRELADRLRGRPGIVSTRSLGTIGAARISADPSYGSELSARLRRAAIERGVLLRPLGDTLYTVPPYCVGDDELERIYEVIAELASLVS